MSCGSQPPLPGNLRDGTQEPTYDPRMTTTPSALISAFDQWDRAGRRSQGAFRWTPRAWQRAFTDASAPALPGVDLAAAIRTIAAACESILGDSQLIDRQVVTRLHTPEDLDPGAATEPSQNVVTAFIAAMIWGYGATGYGPFRTRRVLAADEHVVEHLLGIAKIAQDPEQGGLHAFQQIDKARGTASGYLKYLGPAFGTKFLYFLTAAADGVAPTPVMDAVVRRWFTRETEVRLITSRWHTSSYSMYLDSLDTWALDLSNRSDGPALGRGDVELLIFASSRGDASAWTAADALASEDLSTDQLLDLLQSDVQKLAETRGERGPQLLQELVEWVSEADSSAE